MTIRQTQKDIEVLERKLSFHKNLLNNYVGNISKPGKTFLIIVGAYITRKLWKGPFVKVIKKIKTSLIALLLARMNTHIFHPLISKVQRKKF